MKTKKSSGSIIFILIFFPIFVLAGCGNNDPIENSITDQPLEINELTNQETEENPNFDFAATELGISKEELMDIWGDPEDGPPDIGKIAEELNVDESRLSEILGLGSVNASTIKDPYEVEINGITFEVTQPMYNWDKIPDNVTIEREPIQRFTDENGNLHYYEVIYVETCNLDWYQCAYLAQQAGGYLACLTTEEENEFVFSLVDEEKYFWAFPEEGEHHGIKIGPVLGGYQPEGSSEPDGGWTWLTGEPFAYTNWAQNIDDGIIDKDPRDNTQPNDSAKGQPIMGFGEMNVPVSTWGDYTASQTNPEGIVRGSYACIIEYDQNPLE